MLIVLLQPGLTNQTATQGFMAIRRQEHHLKDEAVRNHHNASTVGVLYGTGE